MPIGFWSIILGAMCVISCGEKQKRSFNAFDTYLQFYQEVNDSLSKNPRYVCAEAQKRMTATTDSTTYYHYVMLLAKAYMFRSDMDSAAVCMNQAEAYCHRNAPTPQISDLYADIYNMRGNVLARQALVDSAVICFSKALNYRLNGDRKEVLPDISINLADAYVRTGQYDKGALWYRKSLSFFDSLGTPEAKRFPAYYGLAQVYMELRDFELCDYYYDMAAQWYSEMMPYERCIYLNNRGNSYYFRKDYPHALEMFRKELAFARSYPDMAFEVHLSEMNLGETFLLMNQTDSAAFYLAKCEDFFRSIGNISALYYLDTQLIELALKQNNLALARKRLAEAVKPDYVEPNMLHIRNRYLQHYYEETGDYKKAYYYQRENQRIDDSTRNERIKMRTAEIDLKYRQDTTLMKQKIFIQQKENEVLGLHQRMYVWMSVCFLILILAVFIYLYNKKQRHLFRMRSQHMINTLRMENIRNRVSPHFIFNVLNREINSHSNGYSENMRQLVKLMRRNLELTEHLCVTLDEELDFVHTYIDLERKSMGDTFALSLHVDKTIDLTREILPSMMIQIPVENAIKHALREKQGKKNLWIDIRREPTGAICIKIRDNGGGYKANSHNRGTGTGMKVILQTVQMLNNNNKKHIDISINNVPLEEGETGCEFVVILPQGYDYNFLKAV
jgi:tetratricopeptide (TPR) repeat protein